MENQIPQTSSLPSSPSKNSNADEWTTVKTAEAEQQKQLEFDKMKNRLSELEELFANHLKDKTALVTRMDQLTSVNAELNVKVCKFDEEVQKLKNKTQKMQDQLSKESVVTSPTALCRFSDIRVNGAFNYKELDGKVVVVKELKQAKDKWYADGYEISFEHPNYKILLKDHLIVCSDFDIVFNRVMLNKVNLVCFHDSKISFSDLQRLIPSCINIEHVCLERSTVKDVNGAIMEIDQILKSIVEINCFIQHLEYLFNTDEITSDTVKKLSQLPPFPNVCKFYIRNIQKGFDLLMFGEFIKKNPKAYYRLRFSGTEEFFTEIKNAEKELRPTLPSTCVLDLYRQDGYLKRL